MREETGLGWIKSIKMKSILFLAIAVLLGVNVWAEEGSKEFKKSFPAASFNELTVTNRYGNIDVRQEGDEFAITASVWVEAKTKAKVDEILEYISITAKEQGGVLNVETLFRKDMSLRQMFAGVTVSIDYHIKVPRGKKVRLVSTDGGVSTSDFTGDLSVEIVSGNFKANSVTRGEFSVKQNKGEFEVEKVENRGGDRREAGLYLDDIAINGGRQSFLENFRGDLLPGYDRELGREFLLHEIRRAGCRWGDPDGYALG